MGYGRRISQEILNGFLNDPQRVFWFDRKNIHDFVFNTKLLEYSDISSPEFVDGLSNFLEVFWFSGVFSGFYVSYDSDMWRVITIEDNNLKVRSISDNIFEVESEIIIKYDVDSKRPIIFNNEFGNPQHLILITNLDGLFDCYATNNWINFNRFNLKQLEDLWGSFKLSTSNDVTLKDYLEMDSKIIDLYNAL